jgi:hypothetical protein
MPDLPEDWDELVKLAQERIDAKCREISERPLRLDPQGQDITEQEKRRILAYFESFGVRFKMVFYNRWTHSVDFFPKNPDVDPREVILATNPTDFIQEWISTRKKT